MSLHIITIAYNAMPLITWHLPVLNRLRLDWTWHVVYGPADNVNCTRWCAKPPRPCDNTLAYLMQIKSNPRVKVYTQDIWPGKVAMFNAATSAIKEPCVLMEIDVDEVWTDHQIEALVYEMGNGGCYTCARFKCVYLLGQNIRTIGENCYGAKANEWLRAWNFKPGMTWKTHEPPFLEGANGPKERCMSRAETDMVCGPFWHYAYVFPEQIIFKEQYYRYPNALDRWQRLQRYSGPWPVRLRQFFPWVDDRVMAEPIHK